MRTRRKRAETGQGAILTQETANHRARQSKARKSKPRIGSLDNPRPLPLFVKELRAKVADGTKTRTRRVVKPQPQPGDPEPGLPGMGRVWPPQMAASTPGFPYGRVGDYAYLREPLAKVYVGTPRRRAVAAYADDGQFVLGDDLLPVKWRWKRNHLPSIHMPKTAARTFVKLTVRRAEWLRDITDEEIVREGIPGDGHRFVYLWNSINGKRGFDWNTNPVVWVLGWELVKEVACDQ